MATLVITGFSLTQVNVMDTMSRLSHDMDTEVAMVFSLWNNMISDSSYLQLKA